MVRRLCLFPLSCFLLVSMSRSPISCGICKEAISKSPSGAVVRRSVSSSVEFHCNCTRPSHWHSACVKKQFEPTDSHIEIQCEGCKGFVWIEKSPSYVRRLLSVVWMPSFFVTWHPLSIAGNLFFAISACFTGLLFLSKCYAQTPGEMSQSVDALLNLNVAVLRRDVTTQTELSRYCALICVAWFFGWILISILTSIVSRIYRVFVKTKVQSAHGLRTVHWRMTYIY